MVFGNCIIPRLGTQVLQYSFFLQMFESINIQTVTSQKFSPTSMHARSRDTAVLNLACVLLYHCQRLIDAKIMLNAMRGQRLTEKMRFENTLMNLHHTFF